MERDKLLLKVECYGSVDGIDRMVVVICSSEIDRQSQGAVEMASNSAVLPSFGTSQSNSHHSMILSRPFLANSIAPPGSECA